MKTILIAVLAVVALSGCQTINPTPDQDQEAPKISADTSTADAIEYAIRFGGKTLEDVRKLIEKRRVQKQVSQEVEKQIAQDYEAFTDFQLSNATMLYQSTTQKVSVKLFERMIRSERTLARNFAWSLAANLPSPSLKGAIEREMTRRIEEGGQDALYLPGFANALQANGMKTGYTLLREGLMEKGDEAFAKAMIALRPDQASNDLMDYLATATVEELRQMNQKTINIYTAMVAMRHFLRYPVAVNHQAFGHLFLYAVSRNQGVAELATLVLQSYLPAYQSELALTLSRLPVWLQMAFVEDVRRARDGRSLALLNELRDISGEADVIEEIKELR